MDNKYTLSAIARKLSKLKSGRFVTKDTIWNWVNNGELQVERVPSHVQTWGKYPYWTDETHLKVVLQSKGYDADFIFE
jgi:hypothetical protein